MIFFPPQHSSQSEALSFWQGPQQPTAGAGADALKIQKAIGDIRERQVTPARIGFGRTRPIGNSADSGKPEELFDALAQAKVMTAQIAMHLENSWRQWLFSQLDNLLDSNEWMLGDKPLRAASYATFLRMILHEKPTHRPSLGISAQGNMLVGWIAGNEYLTIECLPNDRVKWALSCKVGAENERATAETPVLRLNDVLAAYQPERWFGK